MDRAPKYITFDLRIGLRSCRYMHTGYLPAQRWASADYPHLFKITGLQIAFFVMIADAVFHHGQDHPLGRYVKGVKTQLFAAGRRWAKNGDAHDASLAVNNCTYIQLTF